MSCTTLCNNTCYNCSNGPFRGIRLSHDYLSELSLEGQVVEVQNQATRLSISGVQPKVLASIKRGKLVLDEQGGFILKPAPGGPLRYIQDAPANEHLTMRIASKIYNIETADNGLIEIDDQLVYITKRFDINADGTRKLQEDFSQLTQRSAATHGVEFKYNYSYEQFGEIVNSHFGAPIINLVKLYNLIIFNYLVGNGDAHLKNFSGFQTDLGDMILTPAYDLLSSYVHTPNETVTALNIFEDYETNFFTANGYPGAQSFLELGRRLNIPNPQRIIDRFINEENLNQALDFLDQSAMSNPAKEAYGNMLQARVDILSRK
jgi:serine/threonine-protein kinase HipA